MQNKKYSGVVVPMVTPFTNKAEVDLEGVESLTEYIVSNNCHPFILGTTGEALSTSFKMKQDYLKKAVEVNNGRKTLYAGIASMCLDDSVEMAKMFMDGGADILVANLPSYYKLSDRSILKYYSDLADRVNAPLMIYNILSTTHMSIPVAVIEKLSNHPNILGLKDSERDEGRMNTLLGMFKDNPDFSYLLGWAAQSTNFLRNGGDGIVPSTANAYPQFYYKLYKAVLENDLETANKMQEITDNISAIYQKGKLLSESIPGLKVILSTMGICQYNALAPCYELAPAQIEEIKSAINLLDIKL